MGATEPGCSLIIRKGEEKGDDPRRGQADRPIDSAPPACLCRLSAPFSLFPPPPSELDRVYEQGRQDALTFLAAHGLLREAGQGPAAGPGVAVAKEVTAE